MPAGTDVSLDERLLSEAHDAMLTAEDALTEFCGHNDETRGGWALQALTRSIENIRSRVRIAGTSAHPGSYPVGTESHAQASQKTAQEGSVCEVEPLGEVGKFLHEADKFIELCQTMLSVNAPQMAADAAQDAGFAISCADRALAKLKGLPSSPPSSEDTELLDWLGDQAWVDIHIHNDESPPNTCLQFQGAHHTFKASTLRDAVRSARGSQASTTSQKGGQVA